MFHPTGARLLGRDLRPLIGLLVADYALVSWEPPDLEGDTWPGPAQCGDVLPRPDGVLLSRAGCEAAGDVAENPFGNGDADAMVSKQVVKSEVVWW